MKFYTQTQVANILGVGQQCFNHWIHRDRIIPPPQALRKPLGKRLHYTSQDLRKIGVYLQDYLAQSPQGKALGKLLDYPIDTEDTFAKGR